MKAGEGFEHRTRIKAKTKKRSERVAQTKQRSAHLLALQHLVHLQIDGENGGSNALPIKQKEERKKKQKRWVIDYTE